MNGTIVRAWVEPMLVPELRPGDIVIMDNRPAHKVGGVEKAIKDRRAAPRHCRATRPARREQRSPR